MRRAEAVLLSLAALGLGLAYAWLDPQGPTWDAVLRLLRGGGAALGGMLAMAGAGGALLQRIDPELLEGERSLLHATVVGLALWALLGSLLGAVGLLTPLPAAALPALLAAGWLFRPRLQLPRMDTAGWLLTLLVLVLPGLVVALAPAVDTDELYQHLALPKQMLAAGGFVGGPLHPDGSRPLTLHVVYASAMALGGESAPRLLHLGLALVGLDGLRAMGRAWLGPRGTWAPLLLLGSWTVLQPLGMAATDLPAALAVTAALDAALRGRATALALASGLALSLKYTAGGAVAGVYLAARMPWRQRVLAGLAALALLSPWWLRNALDGLHPLFPFAGWSGAALHPGAPGAADMPFQYLVKYGAGRAPLDFLLLPWNAVMTAEPDSFRFLGRLNPAFLALVPTALLALRHPLSRRFAVAGLVAAAFWAAGPHWLRYLVPALPALALWLAGGAPEHRGLPRLALLVCLGLGLPASWSPLLQRTADRLPAATGHEPRQAFIERHHPPAQAVAWANQHLPDDAVVAVLYDWSLYLLDRPVLLGSVEDHVPVRHWLLTRGPAALDDLRAAGATHVLVSSQRFLERTYPFLSQDEFQRDLVAPGQLLDELLLRQATLIHQAGHTRIFRLDVPNPRQKARAGDSSLDRSEPTE